MPGMLFGLNLSTEAGRAPIRRPRQASKAEQLGFDFVSASDHLHSGRPTYEPWILLSGSLGGPARSRTACSPAHFILAAP
jgi:hypothetical protein